MYEPPGCGKKSTQKQVEKKKKSVMIPAGNFDQLYGIGYGDCMAVDVAALACPAIAASSTDLWKENIVIKMVKDNKKKSVSLHLEF